MTLDTEAEQLDEVEHNERYTHTGYQGSKQDDGLFRTNLTLGQRLVDEFSLIGSGCQ